MVWHSLSDASGAERYAGGQCQPTRGRRCWVSAITLSPQTPQEGQAPQRHQAELRRFGHQKKTSLTAKIRPGTDYPILIVVEKGTFSVFGNAAKICV